jgi:signal transduction histidine kinase
LLAATPGAGNGNGLSNMRQRLAEIGGRCDIASAPGKGTRVAFTVTLQGGAK